MYCFGGCRKVFGDAGGHTIQNIALMDFGQELHGIVLFLRLEGSLEQLFDGFPSVLNDGLTLGFELVALAGERDLRFCVPAGIAEGKSQHPRNTDHVFQLAVLNLVVESHSLTVSAVGVLRVNEIALIAFPSVSVRDVQPERSIRTQNAPDFDKHFRQARDIFLRRCLSADLSLHTVITERVIRRGRHTAMNAVIGQSFQDFKAIAGMNDVKLYGGVPPCSFY